MKRREFIKTSLTAAALAVPVVQLAAKEGPDGDKSSEGTGAQIARRRYRDTAMTVPLLGYGMMRMPRLSPERPDIDYATAERQIARAMEVGLNYFDTAYFYHDGLSEKAVGDLLSKYPRDRYYLADKMPVRILKREADLERIFEEQLGRTKAGYFDFYLLHALNRDLWEKAKKLKVYEFLKQKQAEGKIRLLGFSFHDEPEVLKEIAEAHPWDFAQIQLNYLDWTLYRSREQYEILTALGIPVVVMEPLRGGTLATLNPDAAAVFREADPEASVASWAFRYAATLPNVLCILSGMTLTEHLEDNIRTFTDLKPLSEAELKTVVTALNVYRKVVTVPCTDCRYCLPCPAGVNIPRIFGLYNQAKAIGSRAGFRLVYDRLPEEEQIASCVDCGACEKKCPQKIRIPTELRKIDAEMNAPQPATASFWTPNDERFV